MSIRVESYAKDLMTRFQCNDLQESSCTNWTLWPFEQFRGLKPAFSRSVLVYQIA